jgi:hypothetical protein
MVEVVIREPCGEELPSAIGVVARGTRDNPIHVAVFGGWQRMGIGSQMMARFCALVEAARDTA